MSAESTIETLDPLVHEATREEGWEILERQARKRLRLSAQEYIDRWDSGEFVNGEEHSEALRVAMFLPFVR